MPVHVFQVVIEQDEDGVFVAEVPGIRACYAQGDTYEEAMENIRDVLEMCLDQMRALGEVGKGLLRKILRDVDISPEEFQKHL